MTQTTPNKSKIAASLSLILGTALSSGVMSSATAQETEKDIEVIQVSGIRSSVQESMGIKRDSAGVVDAISAEDIGKFPDTNLAESLQRITGISISRNNGVLDQDDVGTSILDMNFSTQDTEITQARLDGSYAVDTGSINFGIESRSMILQSATTTKNNTRPRILNVKRTNTLQLRVVMT